MLLVAAAFAGFFALNMRLGNASFRGGLVADRRKNPLGFWLIQFWLGVIGLAALVAAVSVLLGITPP